MNVLIGQYSLILAACVAAIALVNCAIGLARPMQSVFFRLTRGMVGLFFVLISLSSISLWIAFLSDDFTLVYVTGYSEHALPTAYKIAAFWAGQEGSLLLWAWLLAGMSLVATWQWRHHTGRQAAGELLALMLVCGFFAALMIFAANPFQRVTEAVTDGHGLNPMLQDPAMIAHPPLLFMGYAGYTIPFAAMIGALVAGETRHHWVVAMRRWLLFSWLFLTVGIVLGAWWAYLELGWGGYWAWDPVENASLLPWLTGTALLHSISIQQHRGMLKRWNVFLVAVTFLLCLFGTYLTRSGVIQSVHAFGQSLVGTFFLIFMGFCILFSMGLIFWRLGKLKSERALQGFLSKPGLFLLTNILLTLMTAVILTGTIFPLISGMVLKDPVSVGPAFYNQVILPMALVVLAIMALGPMLSYAPDIASRIKRGMCLPGVAAGIAVGIAVLKGIVNPWTLVSIAIATMGIMIMMIQIYAAYARHRQTHQESPGKALLHVIDANHRRYGGQAIHLGMILMMIGVVGSGIYGTQKNHRMKPGDTLNIANQWLTYHELTQEKRTNYQAVIAKMTLIDAYGRSRPLQPELRFYPKSEKANTQVGLDSSWRRDLYVTLGGWEAGGTVAAMVVRVNPLVSWIWIGGVMAILGAVFSMLPPLLKSTVPHGAKSGGQVTAEHTGPLTVLRLLITRCEKGIHES